MKTITIFDVLVVYSDGIATSASYLDPAITKPFLKSSGRENYNHSYAYFLETCFKKGLKAAFTTSADIIAPAKCKSYWTYSKKGWAKSQQICFAPLIFDKFSPITKLQRERRSVLFSTMKIQPFNSSYIYDLFFDKKKTFDVLKEYTIPTVKIKNSSYNEISNALNSLNALIENHPSSKDFSDEIVLKDQYGAGGNAIYKLSKNIVEIKKTMEKDKHISFLIQPFTLFDKGFSYQNEMVSTDIRIIYLKGKIIQSYIRRAKKNDFRCNEHLGGELIYIKNKEIPLNVLGFSTKIVKQLENKRDLFALDFIISNQGNVYLMEGNSGPGIDWNPSILENERQSKKLIREIVNELAYRKNSIHTLDILHSKKLHYPKIPRRINPLVHI